jgi:hypothetical protein
MTQTELQVVLTEEASKEYEEIRNAPRECVSVRGQRYLTHLLRLPLEQWRTIQNNCDNGVFMSARHLPFDIRGKVYEDPAGHGKTVLITRFKFVKKEKRQRIPV